MITNEMITMSTPLNKPLQVSIHDVLFIIPVLNDPQLLQVYSKEGNLYACQSPNFEKVVYTYHDHNLEKLADMTWVDKNYWSASKKTPNTLRVVCAMGGLSEIPTKDVLLVVQKNSVFTIFSKDALYFKPSLTSIRALCPLHAFDHVQHYAYRKGTNPQKTQDRVYYSIGLTYKGD